MGLSMLGVSKFYTCGRGSKCGFDYRGQRTICGTALDCELFPEDGSPVLLNNIKKEISTSMR